MSPVKILPPDVVRTLPLETLVLGIPRIQRRETYVSSTSPSSEVITSKNQLEISMVICYIQKIKIRPSDAISLSKVPGTDTLINQAGKNSQGLI